MKSVCLINNNIDFEIIKSKRAKRLRFAVYGNGKFIVTSPGGVSQKVIEKYILLKSRWILEKIKFYKKLKTQNRENENTEDYLASKDKAYRLIQKRVIYFSKKYNFKYSKINIRNQKTRWGSCTKRKNLNFNYKVAFLKPQIRDYIIVHELCHLKQFNHSNKFWNLVSNILPNFYKLSYKLKNNGLFMN